MKRVSKRFFVILFLTVAFLSSFSQGGTSDIGLLVTNDGPGTKRGSANDVITRNDETNIKRKAEFVVTQFMRVLNRLATGLYLELPETERLIRESYTIPSKMIFIDSTVIIADDLRQVESIKMAKEKPVFSYLKDFDIFYQKSDSETVAFSNFKVSNIKKSSYLYIKVYFDCLFTNKSKISETPYTLTKKVAELKLEKLNNKWHALIVDIHFLDSSDLHDPFKNDIIVVDEPVEAETAGILLYDSLVGVLANVAPTDQKERDRLRKQNDSIRTFMAYRDLVDSADHAFNTQQFMLAYQFYNEAETMASIPNSVIGKSAREYLETAIKLTRKNISIADRSPEEQHEIYLSQAVTAKNQRRYDEAVDLYNKALLIQPNDDITRGKKSQLTAWISNLSRLDAKYKAGKYKEAINEYDNLIKKEPGNADYYLGRGQCYEKTKDSKKALNDFKKATELDENNFHAFFIKAAFHEKQGSFADALSAYTVCTTNDKTDIPSYIKMADMYLALNNANAAINALDKGITNNPNAAKLYHRKGELFYQQKKLNEAIDLFSKAIVLDPSKGNYFYMRGQCEIDLKKIEEAGEDFVKAKSLGLDEAANNRIQQVGAEFYNEGVVKLNTGKLDAALALMNYAVAIDPAKDGYRFQRGACYFKLKDYANAVLNYRAAIQINPENTEAYKFRGLSKFFQAQFQDAITDFETTLKIDLKEVEVHKYMGDAYLALKDYNKAIASFDALMASPKSTKRSLDDNFYSELYNNKGEAYYFLDKLPLAMSNFKEAIDNNRKNGAIYFNRAKTYLKLKKLGDAEDDFKKALEYDVKNPLWNYKFGEMYQAKEKYDKAINYYNIAIASDSAKILAYDPVYNRAVCQVNLTRYSDALKDYLNIQNNNVKARYPEFDTELGNLYLDVNQPDSALKHFDIASSNVSDPFPMYGKAVAFVQKKQMEEALSWFEKSFALSKIPRSMVSKDKRLSAIKDDKRYKSLVKKYF